MLSSVDPDHATCLDNKRSASGGENKLAGASTAWLSRTQQVVTLSSFEAECIDLPDIVLPSSKCVTDIVPQALTDALVCGTSIYQLSKGE